MRVLSRSTVFSLLQLGLGFESFSSPPIRSVLVCPAPCSTCESRSTTCSECVANAHLSRTMCYCDASFYLSSGYCLPCEEACMTCENSGTCTKCVANASEVTIGCRCDQGYYWTDSRKCDACHETCLKCRGKSANDCTICPTGTTLSENHFCYCSFRSFWNYATKACAQCHPSCYSCEDATAQTCLSCASYMKMIKSPPGLCYCLNGLYWDDISAQCRWCDSSCATCNSSEKCTSCDPSAKLSQSKVCVCESGFYMSSSKCTKCDVSCKTCSKAYSTGCDSCFDTFELDGSSPNICVCSRGTYLLKNALRCASCHPTCKTCDNALATSCLSCQSSSALLSFPPSSCVCKSGYFLSGTTCSECSHMCAECTGAENTQCIACARGAYFTSSKDCTCAWKASWFYASQECVCSSGYYLANDDCEKCSENCGKCLGPNPLDCHECLGDTFMKEAGCECPDGKWLSNNSTCFSCHFSCATCRAAGLTNCITCALNREPVKGVCECADGYVLNEKDVCEEEESEEAPLSKAGIIIVSIVGSCVLWYVAGGICFLYCQRDEIFSQQPSSRGQGGRPSPEEFPIVPENTIVNRPNYPDSSVNSNYDIRQDGIIEGRNP